MCICLRDIILLISMCIRLEKLLKLFMYLTVILKQLYLTRICSIWDYIAILLLSHVSVIQKDAFNFLLTLVVKKVLFWSQIFEMEILMNLHLLKFSESENHFFSGWSLCMCVCVCYQNYSKIDYNRNFKFGILHLYHLNGWKI